jgi:hypothetical protein
MSCAIRGPVTHVTTLGRPIALERPEQYRPHRTESLQSRGRLAKPTQIAFASSTSIIGIPSLIS